MPGPNSINLNGQSTNIPGPYGLVTYQTSAGTSVPLEILALMAEMPWLEQNTPLVVTSQASMQRTAPTNQELARMAGIIYAPASDDRVPGGPAEVVMVNVQPTTQAYLTLLDGSGNDSVLLSCNTWGQKGNQCVVTVELDTGVYTITISFSGVTETFANIEPLNLFSLQYTGGDFATVSSGVKPQTTTSSGLTLPQATIAVSSTNAFGLQGQFLIETDLGFETVTYTGKNDANTAFTGCTGGTGTYTSGATVKATNDSEFWIGASGTEAAGTQAYGIIWDGSVRVDPSISASGGAYTVTVTGTDAETGDASVTSVLSWADGTGQGQQTAVDGTPARNFSYINQIVFANAGGGAPNFIVTGDILRADSSIFSSIGDLTDYLTSITDFDVTDVNGLVNSLSLEDMDPLPPTNITSSAHTYTNAQQAIVNALAGSGIVTAEAIDGGGAPVAITATNMAGGSQTTTSASDWQGGFTALRRVPCSIVVPMTSDATVAGYLKDHCTYMGGAGRNPRNGYVGAAANETLAQLRTRAQALNTRNVTLCGQQIRRASPSGNLEWLDPKYLALLLASMQAGTTQAITYKVPNIVDYRQSPTWNPIDDAQQCIQQMLTIVGELVVGQSVPLTRVIRGLTTYLVSSDPARTDIQPNKSINQFLNFALAQMITLVGEPTTTPTSVLNQVWKSIGASAVTLGILEAFDERTATCQRIANVVLFGATVIPAYSQDFLVLNVNVAPATSGGGGGFTLSLAA